jgi:hypothetical protein
VLPKEAAAALAPQKPLSIVSPTSPLRLVPPGCVSLSVCACVCVFRCISLPLSISLSLSLSLSLTAPQQGAPRHPRGLGVWFAGRPDSPATAAAAAAVGIACTAHGCVAVIVVSRSVCVCVCSCCCLGLNIFLSPPLLLSSLTLRRLAGATHAQRGSAHGHPARGRPAGGQRGLTGLACRCVRERETKASKSRETHIERERGQPSLYPCAHTRVSAGGAAASPKEIPFFEHPSHALLRDNGFMQQKYQRFRARCLKGTWLCVCLSFCLSPFGAHCPLPPSVSPYLYLSSHTQTHTLFVSPSV